MKNRRSPPNEGTLSPHPLLKAEHPVEALTAVVVFLSGLRVVRIGMVAVEELHDMEAAFVHVKVDIPRLKVWRAGFPDLRFRVKALYFSPGRCADALAVGRGRDEQQIQMVVLRLLVDLQDKPADDPAVFPNTVGKALFDLKTMSKTLLYLQENGLTDLDALDAALAESHEKAKTARTDLKKIEAELNAKKELQRHVLNARDAKDLHAEYLKLPKKKQEEFYEENRPALMLYDAAMRYFKENGIKTITAAKRIQDEIEDLTSQKNAGYTEYRASQKREKELQTVKANIEKMLRQQEPEIGQGRKRDEQEL